MNVMGHHWWLVSIGSGNGLVTSDLCRHTASLGYSELIGWCPSLAMIFRTEHVLWQMFILTKYINMKVINNFVYFSTDSFWWDQYRWPWKMDRWVHVSAASTDQLHPAGEWKTWDVRGPIYVDVITYPCPDINAGLAYLHQEKRHRVFDGLIGLWEIWPWF